VPSLAVSDTHALIWAASGSVGRLGRNAWRFFQRMEARQAALTPEIVFRARSLFAIPERSDRLVAATSLELGCPVITRDPAIAAVRALPGQNPSIFATYWIITSSAPPPIEMRRLSTKARPAMLSFM